MSCNIKRDYLREVLPQAVFEHSLLPHLSLKEIALLSATCRQFKNLFLNISSITSFSQFEDLGLLGERPQEKKFHFTAISLRKQFPRPCGPFWERNKRLSVEELVRVIESCPNLTHLHLSNHVGGVCKKAGELIRDLRSLTHLRLQDTWINFNAWGEMGRSETLTSINGYKVKICEREADSLPIEWPIAWKIQDLALTMREKINWVVAQSIGNFVNLKNLNLSENSGITLLVLSNISELKRLEGLSLSFSETVTDWGMVHIGKLTQLKILYLDGTEVTDVGMHYLRGLKELKELSIQSTQVHRATIEEMFQGQELDLSIDN